MSRSPSLRPRKTPVQPRAKATYASILEAAAQVLEGGGVEAFNTNVVAERAGVSIGSLYQYFPGKDALLIALIRREKVQMDDIASRARAAPTGAAALAILVSAAVHHQFDRPELARLIDVEEARRDVRDEVESASDFRGLLHKALDQPDLPTPADMAAAVDDLAELVRLLVDAAGARSETDVAAVERRVLGAVIGYLGTTPARA